MVHENTCNKLILILIYMYNVKVHFLFKLHRITDLKIRVFESFKI